MKKIYRSRKEKMLGGVCGGIGLHMEIDPVIIRLIFIILFLAGGSGLLIYLVALIAIPMEPLPSENGASPSHNEQSPSQKSPDEKGGTSQMGQHIQILGVLYIVFSSLFIFGAIMIFVLVSAGGLISGDETAITVTTIVGSAIGGFLILVSLPGLIGGIAILRYREWARILLLILGVLNLVNVPFGTALGIYSIWALTNEETLPLFQSNRH
jgi:phage shock protein PspC (stress-responsive transcriptional regulator)